MHKKLTRIIVKKREAKVEPKKILKNYPLWYNTSWTNTKEVYRS